ncbi:MAG: hypothetical protein MJ010_08770 [Paludibacteraceae bacterium]|nr:hypothetical protein [Paludibacteraceae bacterium]
MKNKYLKEDKRTPQVADPAMAFYSSDAIADIKTKVLDLVNKTDKIFQLQRCIEILNENSMPCVYSDEEFVSEISASEKSGFVSHDDFKKSCKEKWGV